MPQHSDDNFAFHFGQVHGLKAFLHALVRDHPDSARLLRAFHATSEIGLDQLRALPTPTGAVRAYLQFCDELRVALAREIKSKERPRRRIEL